MSRRRREIDFERSRPSSAVRGCSFVIANHVDVEIWRQRNENRLVWLDSLEQSRPVPTPGKCRHQTSATLCLPFGQNDRT
jgi:hypothetical protein